MPDMQRITYNLIVNGFAFLARVRFSVFHSLFSLILSALHSIMGVQLHVGLVTYHHLFLCLVFV